MRVPLNTSSQSGRISSKAGLSQERGRNALRLAIFTLALVFSPGPATAQQPVGTPTGQSQVRFDGGEVLFLGISDTKSPAPSERLDGYYVVALPCFGSSQNSPRYYRFALAVTNALERDLLDDSTDGTWQHWDIVSAALVAEGLNDRQKVEAYRDKVGSIVRQMQPQGSAPQKDRLTQTVFEILHSRLLTGKYDVGCTNLAQAIDTGNFNCVSATVLFHAMAQQAGLDVCGLEMRGHALSRVRVESRVIDLETTCADWFNLSDRDRNRSDNGTDAGYDTAYFAARRQTPQLPVMTQSPGHDVANNISNDPADRAPTLSPNEVPRNLREISDVQLIATIYYNRGVDELTAGRFNTAIAANVKALHLDPHNDNAWRNLMATLNNWAIARASDGDYLNAAQLLDEGRLVDDDYELFRANQVHTYYHWVVNVADRREYETALTLLRLAEDRLPNQPNLRFLNYTVRRKMANELFASQEDRKAFEQFDLAAGIAPDGVNVAEAELVDVTHYVGQLIDENRLSRAIWLIDRELARHGVAPATAQAPPPVTPSVLQNQVAAQKQTVAKPVASQNTGQFTVQLPDAPAGAPLFNGPIVLDGDETAVETPNVAPLAVTPRQSERSANPASQTVKPELLGQLQTMRAAAVVAWADEALRKRDYPEAVRRLTIGEPSQKLLSGDQVRLLRQTYDEWAAALRSENRPAEAQTVLKLAAASPYLVR